MVWKLRDPQRWMRIPVGDPISFEGEGIRPIRLEVNAVAEAAFEVHYPNGEYVHLAAFRGMDVIEFIADGPVELWVTSTGDVYAYTDEGRKLAFVDDGKVSFAVPHTPRTGAEQIIYMQGLALANMHRRNEELEELRVAYEAEEARREDSRRSGEGELSEGQGEPPLSGAADGGTEGVAGEIPAAS